MAARKAKKAPDQLALDGTAEAYRKGTTERAAERDLTALRKDKTIGSGMGALEVAYRLAAREVDRAERGEDLWGKMKATAELRALRERLAPMTPSHDQDDLLASLRTALRDATQPRPGDAGT